MRWNKNHSLLKETLEGKVNILAKKLLRNKKWRINLDETPKDSWALFWLLHYYYIQKN